MQSVYLQRIMKKYAAKGYEKTKPKQTQFKANFKRGTSRHHFLPALPFSLKFTLKNAPNFQKNSILKGVK